ncbi:MAG: hypothetical protein Q9187_007246, partial [Circinaria calcarea]
MNGTKTMTNAFYSRYVPPVTSAIAPSASLDNGAPPKKDRKRKRASDFQSAKALDPIQVQEANSTRESKSFSFVTPQSHKKRDNREGRGKENEKEFSQNAAPLHYRADGGDKSERKKRKKEIEDQTEGMETPVPDIALKAASDPTPDDDTKHRKIRSKFEKSSRISTQLVRKAKVVDNAGGDQELQNPAPIQTHGLVPLPQPLEVPDATGGPTFSALPKWLGKPMVIPSSRTIHFKELNLSPSIKASLEVKGYNDAFAIQCAIIPMLLQGPKYHIGDLCVSAATGSGKTLGYTLPMAEALRDKPITQLRGLIVVPTRELVTQVRESLQISTAGTGLKIGTAVGSKTLKEEQALLIHKGQKYDPEGYKEAKRKQLEDELDIMDWDLDDTENVEDVFDSRVNFVAEYTSKVDILICTPGRLVDHMKSTKGFNLNHVQWLVIDEADRLLDESFQQWIDIVIPALEAQPILDLHTEMMLKMFHIPKQRTVRKIILSATMTRDVSKLIALKLRQPRLVVLENDRASEPSADRSSTVATSVDLPVTLSELAISIPNVEDKPLYLVRALSMEKIGLTRSKVGGETRRSHGSNRGSGTSSSDSESSSGSDSESSPSSSPKSQQFQTKAPSIISEYPTYGTLVFTNSNESAMRLTRLLCLLRPSSAKEIGSLTKSTATSAGHKTLAAFRKRKLSILVASDRASRGLDIPDLAQVINYDTPTSATSYIHRVGRTARAGKSGSAVTLVAHHEARWFWNEIGRSDQIHRGSGKKVSRIDWRLDSISDDDRSA